MGEPLNNYEAVRAAIGAMIDPRQWGLARQRVTVSTVGVVNRVKQLGQDLPVSAACCAQAVRGVSESWVAPVAAWAELFEQVGGGSEAPAA